MKRISKLRLLFSLITIINMILMLNISIFASSTANDLALTDQGLDPMLRMFFTLIFITFIPILLLMTTSFTRILISMHFLRSALGTQQMPPNQVLVGLALFLTLFLMGGTFTEINVNAIEPYQAGEITTEEFMEEAVAPLRGFMLRQVSNEDIALFAKYDNQQYETNEDIPNRVIIPAFIVSELTKGFIIGFLIYIPFLVIDMVVSSVLMAMGMMMLPPAMISLPFKILFFILSGGWGLLIDGVVLSFN